MIPLLAIYGKDEDFRNIKKGSGTAECMNYAWNHGKEIIILNPTKNEVRKI